MEPLRTQYQAVVALLAVNLIVGVLSIQSGLSLLQYLQEIQAGALANDARAEQIDARQALLGWVQLAVYLGCIVAFLLWFYRTHKNLISGGLEDLRYTSTWTVLGFFIPVVNLIVPYKVVSEVWRGSLFLSGTSRQTSWRAVPSSLLVKCWWAVFVVSSVISNVAGRRMLRAEGLEQLFRASRTMVVGDLAEIPSAILALVLVRRITLLQEGIRRRQGKRRLAAAGG